MVYTNVRFYLLFMMTVLGGCVHYTDRLEANLKSWVGQHPDTLVEQWGAPRSVYVMDRGSKVLTYEASEVYSRTLGYYRRPEIYSVTESCKISFFTDNTQKTIEKYSYGGNPGACYDMMRSLPENK